MCLFVTNLSGEISVSGKETSNEQHKRGAIGLSGIQFMNKKADRMEGGASSNVACEDHEYVTDLRDADCLLGRGTGPNNHRGNVEFRIAVNDLKRAYVATASRKAKKRLVQQAVRSVQQVKNGRFLSKLSKSELKRLKLSQPKRYERIMSQAKTDVTNSTDDTKANPPAVAVYRIVPDEVAMEKTKQALRYICYKKDSRSDSIHSDVDEGDDKSEGSSESEKGAKCKEIQLKPEKKGSGSSRPKKTSKKRKSETSTSIASQQTSSQLQSSDLTAAVTAIKALDASSANGKKLSSIGAFLASPHKRQKHSPTTTQLQYLSSQPYQGAGPGSFAGLASPESFLETHPGAAAGIPPSIAVAAALAGRQWGTSGMLENTEQLIASALASTTSSVPGLVLPSANPGSITYDPRVSMASSILASRSLPWASTAALAPTASSALDREILLAAALRQQQDQERLAALHQHFLG